MSQKGICFILNVNIHGQTSQQDPELAMFCHRTAPLSHNIPGPCQLPNSRQLRSNPPGQPPTPTPPTLIPTAPYLEDISAPTGPPGKAEVVPSAACPWRACTLAAGQSHWEVEGSNSPGAVRRAEIVPSNYTPGTIAEMKQGPRRGLLPPRYRPPPTRPRPVKSGKDYPQN